MRHGYAGYRNRWAVRQLHPAAEPPGDQGRAARGRRHDRAACGVCGLGTACGADGPAGRGPECAPVVRVDVSHSKTRNTGVAEMTKRNAECGLRNVLVGVMALGCVAL